MAARRGGSSTRAAILEAALDAFGTRGFEATSLDALAGDIGITKQSLLYWYPSKDLLLGAVVEDAAGELVIAIERSLDSDRPPLEAVMAAVFRVAVRRPALLGLVREVGRLGPEVAAQLVAPIRPLIERAVAFLGQQMDAGLVRRADPRLLLVFLQGTVIGVATDLEAQRAVGWEPTTAGLAALRRELFAFVRAAVAA